MTTGIKAGDRVFSKSGRFLHIARDAEHTVCGKEIDYLYASGFGPVDCRTCNGRGKR